MKNLVLLMILLEVLCACKKQDRFLPAKVQEPVREQNISPISIPIVNNRYVIQPSDNSAESVNSILDRLERNGFQIVTIGDKLMAIPDSKAIMKSGSTADLAKCGLCGGMNGWLPYPGQKPQLWICNCKLDDMRRYAKVLGWIVTGLVGFNLPPANLVLCTFSVEGISICLDEVISWYPMGIMIDFHNGFIYAQH